MSDHALWEMPKKDVDIWVYHILLARDIDRDTKLKLTLHKKWSFPLRISSVNVTKSAISCGFGYIDWRNP